MRSKKTGLLALAVLALAAGCQSQRLSTLDTPPPLPAAPSGTVTSGQLPPPATPDPSSFPPPPTTGTQVAAVPTTTEPPATAPDLTASSVAGVWNASVSGQS